MHQRIFGEISRNTMLGLCTAVLLLTSVGHASFSLFLPAIGLSFVLHQIGSASGPLLGSIAFDYAGTYDGFLVALGSILLASGAITYGIDGTSLGVAEQAAASPRLV